MQWRTSLDPAASRADADVGADAGRPAQDAGPDASARRQQALAHRFVLIASLAACCLPLAVGGCAEPPAAAAPPTVSLAQASADLVALVDELLASVRTLPTSAEMRGRLGMAYEVNDFETAAVEAYRQAEALDPEDFRWPYFRAMLVAELGDTQAALEAMAAALAIDDSYVPAWLYRGIWLASLGEPEEARSAFERARALGAQTNGAAGIAQALLAQGRAAEAAALLEPLSERLRHPHVYRLLGRTYQALGREDDARIALARGRDPTPLQWRDPLQEQKWPLLASYGGRLVHAENLLRVGRFEEAAAVLEPMRGSGPGDESVLANLALAYGRSGRLELAFETLREGFRDKPDHFRFHNVMASLYQEKGEMENAVRHLRQSVERQPSQTWPYERLGLLLMEEGEYDEALTVLDRALELGIDRPEQILYTTALLEGIAERWGPAIDRLQRAVGLNPAFTKAYVSLGRCLAEAGRYDEAGAALAWAERLDTHPEELASARKRLANLQAGDA